MRTDLSLRLDPKDTPEVEVYDIDDKQVVTIQLGTGDCDHEVSIWGTPTQITALVSQFHSEHTKRLTDALRKALCLEDASDMEVLLRASLRQPEAA